MKIFEKCWLWTVSVENADCKFQFLTNKYLITLYLKSHLISHSSTNYITELNILYLWAVLYKKTSPGNSVDCTCTNKKLMKMNLKHCPLEPFGCIFRPCF